MITDGLVEVDEMTETAAEILEKKRAEKAAIEELLAPGGFFAPVSEAQLAPHEKARLEQDAAEGFPAEFEPTARGHAILVEPLPVSDVTEGGLHKPQEVTKKEAYATQIGVVIDVPPNAWKAFDNGEPWAKAGERVIFVRYAGATIEFNGREYRFLKDEDIIGGFKRKGE